jgi:hypothetical protein
LTGFRPRDGFLLEKFEERKVEKSPELLEIERRQALIAARAIDRRIVDTTFDAEELEKMGSPIDLTKLVGKPVLTLHTRPVNVISLLAAKQARK